MRYVHTNLIAEDWQALSAFYQRVFGCVPVPPRRDLAGPWVDGLTGIPGAHLTGEHLRLPGWGEDGPTLEIYAYHPAGAGGEKTINRPGFGHLAFEVADVHAAVAQVLAAGGSQLGQVVSNQYDQLGTGTFCYLRDPEGNIIELQNWRP